MKARIKEGAKVGQDMGICKWTGNTIFDVFDFTDKRKKLIAEGYGQLSEYGNGALYVNVGDLVSVDSEMKQITQLDIATIKEEFGDCDWMRGVLNGYTVDCIVWLINRVVELEEDK